MQKSKRGRHNIAVEETGEGKFQTASVQETVRCVRDVGEGKNDKDKFFRGLVSCNRREDSIPLPIFLKLKPLYESRRRKGDLFVMQCGLISSIGEMTVI